MGLQIDGIIFSLQRHGGITVYFRELLSQIASAPIASRLLLDLPVLQDLSNLSAQLHVEHRAARPLERFRDCRLSEGATVFHSSYYRRPERLSIPTVVTVHDFIYERYRRGPQRWAHVHQKHAAIRHAQALICISESTRDDLLTWVGVRSDQTVHVIPNGVSPLFQPLKVAPATRPFALFVGERRGYKNFRLALQALAHIPDLELHCVGGGTLSSQDFDGIEPALRNRVRHLGFVTDDDLNLAYNQALCLIYPSSYEGFGIPVVEAMRAGCPVVSIECKAVIEVGGDALERAEAEDSKALAESVLRLREDTHRTQKVIAGLKRSEIYDWQRCHKQTLNVYRSLGAV